MKRILKYIFIILACITMNIDKAEAGPWCVKSYRNMYICAAVTVDLDVLSVSIQIEQTDLREDVATWMLIFADLQNQIRMANVSGENASDVDVFLLGHSLSPKDDTPEEEVTNNGSDGSSASKTTESVYSMLIRPNTAIMTVEAAAKAMDKYCYLWLKHSLEENYDGVRKLKEKEKIIETAVESSEQADDYNHNIRFRMGISLMNQADVTETIKLNSRQWEFLAMRKFCSSPDVSRTDLPSAKTQDEATSSSK